MEISVSAIRKIVVDGQVDSLNINTTTEDVCGNANTLVEIFELLVSFDTAQKSVLVKQIS